MYPPTMKTVYDADAHLSFTPYHNPFHIATPKKHFFCNAATLARVFLSIRRRASPGPNIKLPAKEYAGSFHAIYFIP